MRGRGLEAWEPEQPGIRLDPGESKKRAGIGGSLGSGRGILRSKKNKGDLSGMLASSLCCVWKDKTLVSELRLWSEGSQRNLGRKVSQKSEGNLRSGQRLGSEGSLRTN